MKIYLIDDDLICNHITEHILLHLQIKASIRAFLSADEALCYLKEDFPSHVPDVIFLDLNMPLMSGWDFLDALEPYRMQLKGTCRIYILTSSLDLCDTARSKNYDLVCGLIHKPADIEDMKVILSEIKETP